MLQNYITPRQKTPEGKQAVKNACRAIRKLNPIYIKYLPLEFIANQIFGIRIQKNIVNLSCIDRIINDSFSDEDMEIFSNGYVEMKNMFKSSFDSQAMVNRDDDTLKAKLSDINKAILMALNDTAVEVEKNCSIKIGKYTDYQKSKMINDLKFYNLARATSYQNTTLKGKQMLKNDQFDLYNMAYLGTKDKYWTNDEKWLKKIHFQGIEDFLFKLPTIH